MKKLAVLFSCLALSSCFSAGNHDVLGFRNTFIEYFSTYSISFYGDDNELVSSDYVEENNFKHNVILTAYTGYTVVDTKIYRKDIYRSEYLTANVDGVLNCGSVPVAYQKGERVRAVGEVTIDGTDFVLIDTKLKNFVALVRRDGTSTTASAKSATGVWRCWKRILFRIRTISKWCRLQPPKACRPNRSRVLTLNMKG